jgi:hypothetical protein
MGAVAESAKAPDKTPAITSLAVDKAAPTVLGVESLAEVVIVPVVSSSSFWHGDR